MSTDEMERFVESLSEHERDRLMKYLNNKREQFMALACSLGSTKRLV